MPALENSVDRAVDDDVAASGSSHPSGEGSDAGSHAAPATPTSSARRDLAAAYRLVAHFGLDDSIFTHISASAPASEGERAFLINSYGMRFDEVTASSLVTIDLDGRVLRDDVGAGINDAGFTIHSAVHAARPDVHCVLHTHTVAGVAVACLPEGLLPLNQWSLQFHDRLAYHDYEGIALDLDERERLVADLGSAKAMVLRNHGLLTCGRSVGEAFSLMFNLERSCRAQVAILGMNATPPPVGTVVAERTARQYEGWEDGDEPAAADRAAADARPDPEWAAYLRLVEARYPGFDH